MPANGPPCPFVHLERDLWDLRDAAGQEIGPDAPERRAWLLDRGAVGNFAELYYRLAGQVTTAGTVPLDSLSAGFFSQVEVGASTTPAAAVAALQAVGDQMLQAVIFRSDNLELSEQFDATTGYETSVSNLSWSYASFLSAVRARTAI